MASESSPQKLRRSHNRQYVNALEIQSEAKKPGPTLLASDKDDGASDNKEISKTSKDSVNDDKFTEHEQLVSRVKNLWAQLQEFHVICAYERDFSVVRKSPAFPKGYDFSQIPICSSDTGELGKTGSQKDSTSIEDTRVELKSTQTSLSQITPKELLKQWTVAKETALMWTSLWILTPALVASIGDHADLGHALLLVCHSNDSK